jgi:hypothetical protein
MIFARNCSVCCQKIGNAFTVQRYFLSLFVVLGHVQVGLFFLVFSLHTLHFQGETIKSRQRFDHVVERKEGDSNESILPS